MYSISEIDIFNISDYTISDMLKKAKYDHFFIVGSNTKILQSLMSVQLDLPNEIRLFRDSYSGTVAGALVNKYNINYNLKNNNFSDSNYKGTRFLFIEDFELLSVAYFEEQDQIQDCNNKKYKIRNLKEVRDIFLDTKEKYLIYVPENLIVSDFFSFDIKTCDLLDTNYITFSCIDNKITTNNSIRVFNRKIFLNEDSDYFRYNSFLKLYDFSGDVINK